MTWLYVLRYIFAPLIKWLPDWILKKIYPITRCMDMIHVLGDSIGPHIYINEGRPSKTLNPYPILIINTLPFPITVEYLNLNDIFIESLSWVSNKQVTLNDEIKPGGNKKITVSHDLTDAQANTIRNHPSCPIPKYNGLVRIKSPVGSFDKRFGIETRAFIFKG